MCSRQKYRLYLRRLGGVSERDRVDADTLQRLHEVRQCCLAEWRLALLP